MYKTLLFDLDNTLLDFNKSEEVGLERLYQEFFKQHLHEKKFYDHYHEVNHALWTQVEKGELMPADVRQRRFLTLAETAEHLCPDELGAFYEKHLGENAPWFEGVEEAINQLRKYYQIGVVTNGFSAVQAVKYELSGLKDWCECFVVSETVGIAKPDPRIFHLALQQLGSQVAESLMVGDSINSDYRGALSVGMDFCWINPQQRLLPADLPAPAFDLQSARQLLGCLGLEKVEV